jgi:hypothetical protein
MTLWNNYTVGFADAITEKVEIHFAELEHTEYETAEFVRFFDKYKKQIHVGIEGVNIEYVICNWKLWAEFLLKHGFHDQALAFSQILNDLYGEISLDIYAYIKKLKEAKPIKEGQDKRTIRFERNKADREQQKTDEIIRLEKNRQGMTFKPKDLSQIAYEHEQDALENDYPGSYVGYYRGKRILIDEDKETLIREAWDIHGLKLDLIIKIKE